MTTTRPAETDAGIRIREQLAHPGPLRVGQAQHALAARILQNARGADGRRFDGVWCSSLSDAACRARPDRELIGHGTRLASLAWTLEATSLPVWYDADSGGWPEQVGVLAQRLGRLGVGAMCLEDKHGPKLNSMSDAAARQPAAPLDLFSARIEAARSGAGPRPLVVARIETLIRGDDPADGIARAAASVEAGADAILLHAARGQAPALLKLVAECRGQGIATPMVVVPTAFEAVPEAALVEAGFDVIIYANQLLRAAADAMMRCASALLDETPPSERAGVSVADLLDLIEAD